MDRKQAEWIAARVPGATFRDGVLAVRVDAETAVLVNWGMKIEACGSGLFDLTAERSSEIHRAVTGFLSAIASARAAGILPQDQESGKVADDGRA